MQVSLHKNARTTPAIRRELRASKEPTKALAHRYGLRPNTVRKSRTRESTCLSLPRTTACNALAGAEEPVVVELRKTLLLPLDDLLAVTHAAINEPGLTLGPGPLPARRWCSTSPASSARFATNRLNTCDSAMTEPPIDQCGTQILPQATAADMCTCYIMPLISTCR